MLSYQADTQDALGIVQVCWLKLSSGFLSPNWPGHSSAYQIQNIDNLLFSNPIPKSLVATSTIFLLLSGQLPLILPFLLLPAPFHLFPAPTTLRQPTQQLQKFQQQLRKMRRRSQDNSDEAESPRKKTKREEPENGHDSKDRKEKLEEGEKESADEKQEEANKAALTNFVKNKKSIDVLEKKGIKFFFPIQYETFDVIYKGRDLIARDRTGSGKTLAFSLPVLERFRDQDQFDTDKTKLLIVLPTRQLAIQVKNEIVSIRHKSSEFSVVNVYGGADIHEQMREVREGADVIVATPGRLLDLLERGVIKLNHLQVTVLDEADEMLKQGFQQDIERIFEYITKHSPKKTQNLLFSATIPAWVLDIAKRYLSPDREFIDLIKSTQMKTSKTVEHLGINCPYFSRNSVIADVVNIYGGRHGRTIIFCETKKQANEIILKANLKQEAQVLHGDIPQKQREVAFKAFKEGKLKCLVATNVAARGLDIPEVDLIVQLEPPKDVETYIHRAGRTGRAGRSGICVTFFTRMQLPLIERIERIAKIKLKKTGAPQPTDIVKASARDIVISLKSVSDSVLPHFNDIAKEMIDEVGDPVIALSKALAYISGNTQKISQRSLLNSMDGFITYVIKSPVEFNSTGYIFNFLRNFAPEKLVSEIKGMRKFGNNAAAFDVPDTMKDLMDKAIEEISSQTGRSKGFSIEVATTMAELQELEGVNHRAEKERQPSPQMDERIKRDAYKRKRELQIFVGGLPYNADENEVTEFFRSKKVTTVSVRILKSDQGQSRGVAFVLCADDKSLRRALDMNGDKFGSRTIKINVAANK